VVDEAQEQRSSARTAEAAAALADSLDRPPEQQLAAKAMLAAHQVPPHPRSVAVAAAVTQAQESSVTLVPVRAVLDIYSQEIARPIQAVAVAVRRMVWVALADRASAALAAVTAVA
jgi:hypothetical protein